MYFAGASSPSNVGAPAGSSLARGGVSARPHWGPESRVALYYAPSENDDLWTRGVAWLGRDAVTGAEVVQPDIPGLAAITADAGAYGFHATLKSPMRLRKGVGWQEFRDAVGELAGGLAAFELPRLEVVDLAGFLALHEAVPCPPLQAFCDACVAWVDHFRAAPNEAELAYRRRGGLTEVEDANLLRWGYQYVFSTWFFHMTLTRRLTVAEQAVYRAAAEAWFAPSLAGPRRVDHIAMFAQAEPGKPFLLVERVPFATARRQ